MLSNNWIAECLSALGTPYAKEQVHEHFNSLGTYPVMHYKDFFLNALILSSEHQPA